MGHDGKNPQSAPACPSYRMVVNTSSSRKSKADSLSISSSSDDSAKDDSPINALEPPSDRVFKTRYSVSAEPTGSCLADSDFVPPVHPKTEEEAAVIRANLQKSYIFQYLSNDALAVAVAAFQRCQYPKAATIIRQGEDGDRLYLIAKGAVDVFVSTMSTGEQAPRQVCEMHEGEMFGELALLYNAPRAATVVAKTPLDLWALDRSTFSAIVQRSFMKQRKRHVEFLHRVQVLSSLSEEELDKLSDALVSVSYGPEETIIKQGDVGDDFFIISSGKAKAVKSGNVVLDYGVGDFFGELSLLSDEPRAASVVTLDEPVECLRLDRASFKRLLASAENLLKSQQGIYREAEARVTQSAA